MRENPTAEIKLNNGRRIILELRPDYAFNEVCSFIYAAESGFYNHFAIQRIVPGSWIDISYSAFNREECQYFLQNRIKEESNGLIKRPEPGDVCLGYYSDAEISGTEFFFPLRECDDLLGKCPVIGQVTEGMEELYRIGRTPTYPVDLPVPFVINCPSTPEIIVEVIIDRKGVQYPMPEQLKEFVRPVTWPAFSA